MKMMRYKEFGRTGKKVSVLGLGCMRFDPTNEPLAIETILTAIQLGINYLDTAPGYCQDKSEEFVGRALAELPVETRKKVYVSTKSTIYSDPTAEAVRRRIEQQLKRLGKEKIDFYNMWNIMDLEQYERVMARGGPYEGALRAKEEGLIDHLCCTSHASGEDVVKMVKEGAFEGITLGYNLLNHTFRQAGLKAAAAAGWGVVTMNPLGGGLLTRDAAKWRSLSDSSGSFVATALRFNLAHSEITVVLSGMKNPAEVKANVATAVSLERPDPEIIENILERFAALGESFCTGCRYCLEYCPQGIQIHLYTQMWDQVRLKIPEEAQRVYEIYLGDENRWLQGKRTTDCTECGECEEHCPQRLPIREYLDKIGRFLGEK